MTAKQAKIAIYGAGAMGTVLGALLTQGGLSVDLITRNVSHVQSLNRSGAYIDCSADGKTLHIPVHALLPSEMHEKYDVVFLMTKQRYNREIVNGMPEGGIAEIVGTERTYGAVTSFGANFTGDGRVELTSKTSAMHIDIGGYRNDGAKLSLLQDVLNYAKTNERFVRTTDNLIGSRWVKLSINAAFSGLSVVTGMSFGEVARKRKTRKVALGIFRECVAVASAQDIRLPPTHGVNLTGIFGKNTPLKNVVAYLVLPFFMRKHKKLTSGMLRDVQNGKKCEIDFIDGVVATEGERVLVPAPLCRRVTELVHGIENGLYETTYANMDFFFVESAND